MYHLSCQAGLGGLPEEDQVMVQDYWSFIMHKAVPHSPSVHGNTMKLCDYTTGLFSLDTMQQWRESLNINKMEPDLKNSHFRKGNIKQDGRRMIDQIFYALEHKET